MNAILTGSRVYGEPRPDSDIDLVVLVSEDDMMNLVGSVSMLKDAAGKKWEVDQTENITDSQYGIGASSAILRFGPLNLIVTTDPLQFEIWRRGTEEMKRYVKDKKPLSRNAAIQFLRAMRQHHGLLTVEPDVKKAEAIAEELGSGEASTDLW